MYRQLAVILLAITLLVNVACKTSSKTSSKKPTQKPKTTSTTTPQNNTPTTATPSVGLAYEKSELLSPVLEKAQKLKKPVFLVFTAGWCAPCKVMKDEVFSQKQTYSFLNDNFLNYEVNMDIQSGKNIAGLYSVSALPTLIFVNPQGLELERHQGMATHTILTRMGNSAISKVKK